MAKAPSPPDRKKADFHACARQRLDRLSEKQEELSEEREALLVKRSELRSLGKRVHAQRRRNADAEALFMTKLREFYNNPGPSFPDSLTSAFEKVQEERDRLGSLETDYLQAEETLGGEEWGFMDRENDLYQYDLQDLLPKEDSYLGTTPDRVAEPKPTLPQPETMISSQLATFKGTTTRLDELITEFNALRPHLLEILTINSTENSDLTQHGWEESQYTGHGSQLLDEKIVCEVQVQQLRQDLMNYAIPAVMILFPAEADSSLGQVAVQSKMEPQALMDGALPDSFHGFPKRERLLEWLLRHLLESLHEQSYFTAVLGGELDAAVLFKYRSLRDQVCRFWLHDGLGDPLLLGRNVQSLTNPSNPGPGAEVASDVTIRGPHHRSQSLCALGAKRGSPFSTGLSPHGSRSLPAREYMVEPCLFSESRKERPPCLLDKSHLPVGERLMNTVDFNERPQQRHREYHLLNIGGWISSQDQRTLPSGRAVEHASTPNALELPCHESPALQNHPSTEHEDSQFHLTVTEIPNMEHGSAEHSDQILERSFTSASTADDSLEAPMCARVDSAHRWDQEDIRSPSPPNLPYAEADSYSDYEVVDPRACSPLGSDSDGHVNPTAVDTFPNPSDTQRVAKDLGSPGQLQQLPSAPLKRSGTKFNLKGKISFQAHKEFH
jgi:hypothetical protein